MTTKPGFLIELEGGDGTGKHTQTGLLNARLVECGWEVGMFSFPDDDTPFGGVIRAGLNGRYGDFLSIDPHLVAPLYMADRGVRMPAIMDVINRGGIALCDRYAGSNLAHQGVKIANRTERDEFQAWLETLEFERLGHHKPDLVVLLDVPPEVSQGLADARGVRDQAEANADHIWQVREEFIHLATQRGWFLVTCADEQHRLHPPQEIHEMVWEIVHGFLSTRS